MKDKRKVKLLLKPKKDEKVLVGKIDLTVVAGSVCACGCSCWKSE